MDDSIKQQSGFCSWNSKSHDSPPRPSRQRNTRDNGADEETLCREVVEIISSGGDTNQLKLYHCRAYFQKHLLRMGGTKQDMIQRIREHLELKDNGGITKYPVDSFVVDCTGDVHVGDTILFRHKVFEKTIPKASSLPPLGERVVVGRVVKESSTLSKTSCKSTFTIEILWTSGVSSLPPLYLLNLSRCELYQLCTYRQLRPSEEASIRAMRHHAREEAKRRAKKAREVTGDGLHEQSHEKQGAALRTPKLESEDHKGEGEDSSIKRDKGKSIVIDLEDDNIKSNATEDNQQLTQSHNSSASQEPAIMEIEMITEGEGTNEKQIQGEFDKGKQSSSAQVEESSLIVLSKDMEDKHKSSSRRKKRKYVQEEKLKEKVQQQSEAAANNCERLRCNEEEDDDGLFQNSDDGRHDSKMEVPEKEIHNDNCDRLGHVEEEDGDVLFQNSDDGRDDSKIEVPEKEKQSNISLDMPGASIPISRARESSQQWRSITSSLNPKLGKHLQGEKSENMCHGTQVIPDFSGEVRDNKVSAAAAPHTSKAADEKKNSRRKARQYLWIMRKQMKYYAPPRRQYSNNSSAKGSYRWELHGKCYISDCPQKAARKCVNKLCRSCCVAVTGSCNRHHANQPNP